MTFGLVRQAVVVPTCLCSGGNRQHRHDDECESRRICIGYRGYEISSLRDIRNDKRYDNSVNVRCDLASDALDPVGWQFMALALPCLFIHAQVMFEYR